LNGDWAYPINHVTVESAKETANMILDAVDSDSLDNQYPEDIIDYSALGEFIKRQEAKKNSKQTKETLKYQYGTDPIVDKIIDDNIEKTTANDKYSKCPKCAPAQLISIRTSASIEYDPSDETIDISQLLEKKYPNSRSDYDLNALHTFKIYYCKNCGWLTFVNPIVNKAVNNGFIFSTIYNLINGDIADGIVYGINDLVVNVLGDDSFDLGLDECCNCDNPDIHVNPINKPLSERMGWDLKFKENDDIGDRAQDILIERLRNYSNEDIDRMWNKPKKKEKSISTDELRKALEFDGINEDNEDIGYTKDRVYKLQCIINRLGFGYMQGFMYSWMHNGENQASKLENQKSYGDEFNKGLEDGKITYIIQAPHK
jgi:hypothetical protein